MNPQLSSPPQQSQSHNPQVTSHETNSNCEPGPKVDPMQEMEEPIGKSNFPSHFCSQASLNPPYPSSACPTSPTFCIIIYNTLVGSPSPSPYFPLVETSPVPSTEFPGNTSGYQKYTI
ncbi:hypothetical protein O181_000420 [Austropuccinia psidii MF-1]|uniref:Uncharacterized protein n=1 Tax=Austropuccinia psidii MF-1 TaxID=1389203 RepID=A0A9Q3GAV2_9BASI|nr:hypothetical protein [Austropuccinia psidii MF-1]